MLTNGNKCYCTEKKITKKPKKKRKKTKNQKQTLLPKKNPSVCNHSGF